MSVRAKLRRRGAIGVFSKISTWYWRAKSRLYYAPQFASFGAGSVIRKPVFVSNPAGISIGSGTFIRDGARLEVVDREGEPGGRLLIGDRVTMEQGVHLAAGGVVHLGDDVCLAANVSILDTTHPLTVNEGNRVNRVLGGKTFVIVGARTFIGTGSTILPGVTIGEDAVIGAGSVVTHDVPRRTVVAGVPAKPIYTLDETDTGGEQLAARRRPAIEEAQ